MSKFMMQGRSSVTGKLVTWESETPDYTGVDFPGPGTPSYVAATEIVDPYNVLRVGWPEVTSISPNSGVPEGGDGVHTITGKNFPVGPDPIEVRFGNVAQLGSVFNATTIFVVPPPGEVGTVDISVANANGRGTLVNGYTYAEALPTLESIDIARGGPLGGGVERVLVGTNFVDVISVTFGGAEATITEIFDDTSLGLIVPVAPEGFDAPGFVDIVITTGAGSATLTDGYEYTTVVTSITPNIGYPAGGNFRRVIVGEGFTGATDVTLDGSSATDIVVVDDKTITCLVPAHAAAVVDLAVTSPSGTDTLANGYEYFALPTTNKTLDLDAAAGVVQLSGLVVSWADQSGNSYNATQAVSGSRPSYSATIFNGKPGITFSDGKSLDVAADFVDIATVGAYTLYVVGKADSTSNETDIRDNAAFISEDQGDWGLHTKTHPLLTTKINVHAYHNGATYEMGVATLMNPSTKHVWSDGFTGTTLWLEDSVGSGGSDFTDPDDVGATGALIVGANYTKAKSLNGVISKIVTYNVGHDSDLRSKINRLLQAEWGVNAVAVEAPVVDSCSPLYGQPGDVLTLSGSGFTGLTSVSLEGYGALDFNVIDDSTCEITLISGPAPNEIPQLSLVNALDTYLFDNVFTYYPVPNPTACFPSSDVTGATITITGSGFGGATAVYFDGILSPTIAVVDPSYSMTAEVPAGLSGGSVDIQVVNPQWDGTGTGIFTFPYNIAAAQGSFTETGQAAALKRGYKLSAGQGSFTETGQNATLTYTPYLFRVDFSALTLGGMSAASFLSATGLTFTRSSESTVQTSASTVETAANVGNDYACIGSPDGTKKGLVIQHKTRNLFGSGGDNAPRDLTATWTGGTAGTVTADYAAGPDGVTPGGGVKGCSRVSGASGTYGPYASTAIIATSTKCCLSSWQRSRTGAGNEDMMQIFNTGSPGATAKVTARTLNTTWARLTTLKGTTVMSAVTTVDCRDYSAATGGQTARARDVQIDYAQLEYGEFPTEAIRKGATNRSPDVLSYGTLSNWYASGRLRAYFAFYPKHDSSVQPQAYDGTNQAAVDKYYLLAKDSSTYVRIDAATMKIEAKTSAVSFITSTNAMSWTAQDLVEVFVEIGTSATNMWYRVNSGSWTALESGGSSLAAFSATGTAYVGKVDTDYGTGSVNTGSLVCWLKEIRFYGAALYPSGLP